MKKCRFHVQRIKFLRWILSFGSIKINSDKLDSILIYSQSETEKQLLRFLGMTIFFKNAISEYFHKTVSLTDLLRKDIKFIWTKEQEQAFQKMKNMFRASQALRDYDLKKKTFVKVNASNKAIKECLCQGLKRKAVSYYSRKLSLAEQNYIIEDKKMLAIVLALQNWRVYVQEISQQIVVLFDHKNFQLFKTVKKLNKKQTKWSKCLADYNFRIKHIKEKQNVRADALSRKSDYEADKFTSKQLFTENNEVLKLAECSEDLERIIKKHHELRDHKHSEIQRTYEKVMRKVKVTKEEVASVLKKCTTCIIIKKSRRTNEKSSIAIETPRQFWQIITINFITELFLSIQTSVNITCDIIMTVIDKFTKYIELVSTRKNISAETLTHILIDEIIKNHGMSEVIISDRDKLFIFKFWEALIKRLEIKRKMSTAFHSRTDEQSERTNQTIQQYFWTYVSKE